MVREAISGNRDEFRRLFEQHADAVYRYLYRLAGNRHDAEDLLQETFARLWRKRDQFRGDGSVAGYLRRIAYRTFLNARNRLSQHRLPPLDGVDPADTNGCPSSRVTEADWQRHLRARVRRAVDELPEEWRHAFILFRYEGLSVKEVAAMLELTPKAVELRLARALKRVASQAKGEPR